MGLKEEGPTVSNKERGTNGGERVNFNLSSTNIVIDMLNPPQRGLALFWAQIRLCFYRLLSEVISRWKLEFLKKGFYAEEKISLISNESFFYFLFADRNTFPGVLCYLRVAKFSEFLYFPISFCYNRILQQPLCSSHLGSYTRLDR